MPKIDDNALSLTVTGTNFQFSAVRPEDLGSLTYTLVTLACDVSSSVDSFAAELTKMVKSVVEACQKHPQKENLMLRFITFNSNLQEVFGFKPVLDIDINNISNIQCNGCTALFDATYYSVGAMLDYGKLLVADSFSVNGAVYIITDGADNSSSFTPKKIKTLIDSTKQAETLDSLVTVLIGVNDQDCGNYLQNFQNEAGISQYVSVANASAGTLAKLANFISQSISSSSKAINQGKGSIPIVVNPTF